MLFRPMVKKIVFAGFLVFSFSSVFAITNAHAQTATSPQFLVSWKTTGSYVPSFYTGKALPSYGSKITASFELVLNGKVLNLQDQTIYWYLDQILVGGGAGAQQVIFSPLGTPPDSLSLQIVLPSYNGVYLTHTVQIPFVTPEAVIYAPYPNKAFSTNPLSIKALPFFFNATSSSNLNFTWSVNGQAGSTNENPQEADIVLPKGLSSGSTLDITLNAENPFGSVAASDEKILTYQNSL